MHYECYLCLRTSPYVERGGGGDGTHGVGCRTDVAASLGARHTVESQHSVLVHHLRVLRELRVVRSEIKRQIIQFMLSTGNITEKIRL